MFSLCQAAARAAPNLQPTMQLGRGSTGQQLTQAFKATHSKVSFAGNASTCLSTVSIHTALPPLLVRCRCLREPILLDPSGYQSHFQGHPPNKGSSWLRQFQSKTTCKNSSAGTTRAGACTVHASGGCSTVKATGHLNPKQICTLISKTGTLVLRLLQGTHWHTAGALERGWTVGEAWTA